MPRPITIPFNLGEASRKADIDLESGELSRSVGVEYRRMDKRIWCIKGRKFLADLSALVADPLNPPPVRGLRVIEFDDGTFLLLTMAGDIMAVVDPADGSSVTVEQQRDSDGTHMSAAHLNDRWFVTTGFDHDLLLYQDAETGDLVTKDMGMVSPQEAPVVFAEFKTLLTTRPDDVLTVKDQEDGKILNTILATDDALDPNLTFTFCGMETNTKAEENIVTYSWDAADFTTALDRSVRVQLRVSGLQNDPGDNVFEPGTDPGYIVETEVELSENAGGDFRTIYFRETSSNNPMKNDDFASGAIGSLTQVADLRLRIRQKHLLGTSHATLRIYDITEGAGSAEAAIDTGDKLVRWAYSEIDDETGSESPLSPAGGWQFDGQNYVTLTFPATPQNDRATARYIYRTPPVFRNDPAQTLFGRVGTLAIDETTWSDQFTISHDRQAIPLQEMVQVGNLFYSANSPPPLLDYISVFDGILIGVKGRSFYRAAPGKPESWPEVLRANKIPMPDNDNFIACEQVNDNVVLLASSVVVSSRDIIRVVSTQLVVPRMSRISGDGCVGPKALALLSRGGDTEEVLAWVSPFGIRVTDGTSSRDLASHIDWVGLVPDPQTLSSSVLHWDRNRQVLIFAYDADGDGVNDHYALIHMAPEHQRQDGNPAVTTGHAGVITDLAGATYLGKESIWSGNTLSRVYQENVGDIDESLATDAFGSIQLDVESVFDGEWRIMELVRGRLRFTNTEDGRVFDVDITTSLGDHDQVLNTQVISDPADPNEFFIGIAGDRVKVAISALGKGDYAIRRVELDANRTGRGASLSKAE